MKTYLTIIIIFVLLSVQARSNNGIGGHIEIGKDILSNVSYTDLKIEYEFNIFNLKIIPYGRQLTWFYLDYPSKGYPFRDIYIIGTEIKYMNVVFGSEHYCSHAVSSGEYQYTLPEEQPLAYNLTKIFIRYEF